jgi:uncharacterized lipoprotein YmbA
MMRNGVVPIACAVLLGPLLVGCVSLQRTEEARFFVLRSQAPSVSAETSEPMSGLVGLLPVRLPGHLNRPQMVTEGGPNELIINEFARWAEPLEPALTRVVAENLATLLPDHQVITSPFPARPPLLCRVSVEIESFAPQKSGEVRLDGRWVLLSSKDAKALAVRPFQLRRGPVPVGVGGVDAEEGAAAMSRLLLDLAEQIAEGVREVETPKRPSESGQ